MMAEKRLVEFTCPECRGPMHTLAEGPPVYRCKVGHAYSVRALLAAHDETQERQLWAAALALDEAAVLAAEVAASLPELREQLMERGLEKERQAQTIRQIIEELRPFPTE